ncbi:MAG: phenylalanine--tRNA ligase subunit beta [Rhizobiales bacterium]|nr:phenylalanine--tRNA ligase subunit beta [Hyphomicrobiales bacterium]
MKFTLSWLRDHLETSASVAEIAATLDRIGLEVEGIENPAKDLGAFVIARVLEAKPHPDADRLRVCQVDFGGKAPIQVVCGAPNARTGMVGVFAPEGTYVPGTDLLLKKARIRGVDSSGMLCSERELKLSDEHDGIIDLEPQLASRVGERFVEVVGLDDPVFDVAVTANRPDALGVRGIARDLAAAGLGTLKKDPYAKAISEGAKGRFPCPVEIRLDLASEVADACPMFAGRVIRGVKNGPSPAWLQKRLRAVGLRPINALVDITNYVSYDRARPLHVYDVAKLDGAVRARLGKAGESFLALDGKTYAIKPGMTVIGDESGALGLGGIMGGESTGVTEGTVDVLIESALFDRVRTAATGRALSIHSDARARFERGVDPQSAVPGVEIATRMVMDLCGGEPSEVAVAGRAPQPAPAIRFDPAEVARLTGIALADAEIKTILKSLGFGISGKGTALDVSPPGWRPDIEGTADLVEEVIRIHGIDNVVSTPMKGNDGVARPVMTERQRRVRAARRVLAGRGMVEAITWSFIPQTEAEHFGGGGETLRLANPISSELSTMRPSLLAGLLTGAQRNRDRAIADVALFEVGQIYEGDREDQQFTAVVGVRVGGARLTGGGRHWRESAAPVDLYDAKADLIALLEALGIDAGKAQAVREAPAWYHPGRSAVLKMGPKIVLGSFGEINPRTLKALDVSGPAVAFELRLEDLPGLKRKMREKGRLELAQLQPVKRDFAFVLARDVAAGDVLKAVMGADKGLITGASVFDIFEGAALGEGRKSLAIEVTLQPRNETLTDEAIEAIGRKIVAEVKKATGGEIRG